MKKEKILVITVPESKNKPHRCSSGFYIRSNASTQKLNRNEIWEFMRDEELFNFDRNLCKEFVFKRDFDKEKLFHFLDRTDMSYSKRNYIQLLENLKVAKRKGDKTVFNNAGALFFSKNLDRIFPHASISCAIFKGTDKHHNIIDRKIFNRDIVNNVEDSLDFLKKHLRLEYHFPTGQLRRKEVLEIPEDALREALVNAVTHRNYLATGISVSVEIFDDRVEIYNFGTLPKELKRSEFGKRSVPRNELIAQLMLRANYIEQMGTGIKKMRRLVRRAKLKPIKFTFTGFTTVTFYRPPHPGGRYIKSPEVIAQDNLLKHIEKYTSVPTKKAKRFLKMLYEIENETFSKPSFSKTSSVTLRTLTRDITLLKKYKLIFLKGSKKFGQFTVTDKYKKLKILSQKK